MELEEIKKILENKLNVSQFIGSTVIDKMCLTIFNYSKGKRMSISVLDAYLDETILFLDELCFNKKEIIIAIFNSPSLLHSNKKDLLAKYLLLAPLIDSNTFESIRKDVLINNPKYFVMGISTMYARKMYLENKGSDYLTKWYLLKTTNAEFENCFGISKEQLVADYPFDENNFDELLDLPGNEEIKERIRPRSGGRV